jgi:hypothetical protein
MAQPKVTAAAMQRAKELMADCKTPRAVVAVSWEPLTHNNVRGTDGKTHWIRTEGRWTVSVGDLHVEQGANMPTTRVGGLEFLFCGVREDDPRLDDMIIDYADGDFVVRR